ncbi:MAG: dienelactone hydrolase family protein [Candidatus Sericytochromatia bacterium]
METKNKWESINVGDKNMSLFLAYPYSEKKLPVVVLFQEIFGVNHHIRDVAERIAKEGYFVVAPDLFHREIERYEADYNEEGMKKGFELYPKITNEIFLNDVKYVFDSLKNYENANTEEVFTMGFCMGGRLTYLSACEFKLKGALSFYGGGLAQTLLDKTNKISCPIKLFFGGKDSYISHENVEQIRNSLTENKKDFEIFFYPEADHGFFCNERGSYNPEAASDAWEKVKLFLK